jgi:hypothetical protein
MEPKAQITRHPQHQIEAMEKWKGFRNRESQDKDKSNITQIFNDKKPKLAPAPTKEAQKGAPLLGSQVIKILKRPPAANESTITSQHVNVKTQVSAQSRPQPTPKTLPIVPQPIKYPTRVSTLVRFDPPPSLADRHDITVPLNFNGTTYFVPAPQAIAYFQATQNQVYTDSAPYEKVYEEEYGDYPLNDQGYEFGYENGYEEESDHGYGDGYEEGYIDAYLAMQQTGMNSEEALPEPEPIQRVYKGFFSPLSGDPKNGKSRIPN